MCRMCRDLRHIVRHIKVRHEVLTATHFLQQDHDTFSPARPRHILYDTCDTFSIGPFGKAYFDFFFNLIPLNYSYSENSSRSDLGICPTSSWSDLYQTVSG